MGKKQSYTELIVNKISRLKNWQVAIIVAVLGFAVFSTGLNNSFQGDDSSQIVNNPVVHSISNIKLFFEGGTFYNNQGIAPLSGEWFRPIATTVFSIIYTLFGLHQIYYHIFQIALCIGSAILLYLFFRRFFKPLLVLPLCLIFLVHPINSQVAFAIPSMQDALYFFFGIFSLWVLVRFKSIRSLIAVAFLLFLSMLSKETGILFVAISLLYVFMWDRERLYAFIGIMIAPIGLYLLLKVNAVGLAHAPTDAPIDSLSLAGRLMTDPSIFLLYFTKLLFPWRLASSYYWVYPTLTIRHFLVPLVIDLAIILTFVYMAFVILKNSPKHYFRLYLFFSAWAIIGLLSVLQFFPLDMTASETWFYFSFAGLLGMLGIVLVSLQKKIKPELFMAALIVIVVLFGIRTVLRGTDWSSTYKLSSIDILSSSDNYIAEKNLAIYYFNQNSYVESTKLAQLSVNSFPNAINLNILGQDFIATGNYQGAANAFINGMKYQQYYPLYENMASLTAVYGNTNSNKQFLLKATKLFPNDPIIWFYLAILYYRSDNLVDAKYAISESYNNVASLQDISTQGISIQDIDAVYERITSDLPLNIAFSSHS